MYEADLSIKYRICNFVGNFIPVSSLYLYIILLYLYIVNNWLLCISKYKEEYFFCYLFK